MIPARVGDLPLNRPKGAAETPAGDLVAEKLKEAVGY